MTIAAMDETERRAAFSAAREQCRWDRYAYMPSFFLPPDKRDGIFSVWAFSRLIEQAVAAEPAEQDCCDGGAECRTAAMLKSRLHAVYEGNIELPLPQFRDPSQWVLVAVTQTVRRFEVSRDLWDRLVDGVVELRRLRRVATWRSLDVTLDAVGG